MDSISVLTKKFLDFIALSFRWHLVLLLSTPNLTRAYDVTSDRALSKVFGRHITLLSAWIIFLDAVRNVTVFFNVSIATPIASYHLLILWLSVIPSAIAHYFTNRCYPKRVIGLRNWMALGVLRQSLGLAWLISLQLVALLIALLQEIFPAALWQISEIFHNFADIEASGSVFWFVLGVLLISFSIFYYRTYLITISSFLKLGKVQMFKFSLIHFVFFSIFVAPLFELGESVRESQESKEGLLYEIMIFVDGPIKKYLPF